MVSVWWLTLTISLIESHLDMLARASLAGINQVGKTSSKHGWHYLMDGLKGKEEEAHWHRHAAPASHTVA